LQLVGHSFGIMCCHSLSPPFASSPELFWRNSDYQTN
jgi:hypothetical protein